MLPMSAVIVTRAIASLGTAFLMTAFMTPPPAPAHAAELVAAFHNGLSADNAGNYRRALATWEPLARAGDAQAQTALGFMYDAGRGVPRDSAGVARLFSLAAE
jgi:uncharacterized protein